jgi:hypothetical protein
VRRFLHVDEATRELRLVMTDTFDGVHERTEFRCIGSDRQPLRGAYWLAYDGADVAGDWPRFHLVQKLSTDPFVPVAVEERAVGITERVPCADAAPRHGRGRRRSRPTCTVCLAEATRDAIVGLRADG